MDIILNERTYVETILASGELSNNVFSDLTRIGKYYFAEGLKKAAVKKKLTELVKVCRPDLSENYEHAIDRMVNRASRHKLLEIDKIPIYAGEMQTIAVLPSMPLQRLAFTLLCLGRMGDMARGEMSGWVNTRDAQLFALANVPGSRNEHSLLLNDLKSCGLVKFPKAVNSTNIAVLFSAEEGEPVVEVSEMRDLGYQYSRFIGKGRFVPCAVCGMPIPLRDGKQIGVYCSKHEPQRQRNRVVECPDCGKLIVAPPTAKTNRCPRCYEIYRRNAVRASVARHRSSDAV